MNQQTKPMTTNEQPASSIPSYVLLGKDGPLGPSLMQFFTGPAISAVYGFSSKNTYDRFIEKSTTDLKPYPLTPRALQDQIAQGDDVVRIVVLDARGPRESGYCAASISSVLKAHQENSAQIEVGFRLSRATFSNEYRVEKLSGDRKSESSKDDQS